MVKKKKRTEPFWQSH